MKRSTLRIPSGTDRFTSVVLDGGVPPAANFEIPLRGKALQIVCNHPPPENVIPDPLGGGASSVVQGEQPGGVLSWNNYLAQIHFDRIHPVLVNGNLSQAPGVVFVPYGPLVIRVVAEFERLIVVQGPLGVGGLTCFHLIIEHETEEEIHT